MLALKTDTPGPRNELRPVLGNTGEALVGFPATVVVGSVGLAKDAALNQAVPGNEGPLA